MLQIKKLNLTHKKDLRVILDDFNLVLNDGDKAVIIGEEGNGKSTLMKWIYDPSLIENYIEADGERVMGNERFGYLPQEMPDEDKKKTVYEYFSEEEIFWEKTPKELSVTAGKFGIKNDFFYSSQMGRNRSRNLDQIIAHPICHGIDIVLILLDLFNHLRIILHIHVKCPVDIGSGHLAHHQQHIIAAAEGQCRGTDKHRVERIQQLVIFARNRRLFLHNPVTDFFINSDKREKENRTGQVENRVSISNTAGMDGTVPNRLQKPHLMYHCNNSQNHYGFTQVI